MNLGNVNSACAGVRIEVFRLRSACSDGSCPTTAYMYSLIQFVLATGAGLMLVAAVSVLIRSWMSHRYYARTQARKKDRR
jgi:hypothetical protein